MNTFQYSRKKAPSIRPQPPVQHPTGPKGEDLLEAHAENQTPAVHRIFGFYRLDNLEIMVLVIAPPP